MKKKVVVALSGGVDSSVAAALLKQQGFDCVGMHLHFWNDPSVSDNMSDQGKLPQNKCCTAGSLEDARRIAAQLDMPFYVMNVEEKFKERVVDYFLETYAAGQTPNPCVACNRSIKFGELLKRAKELKADYLATGHYVKVVHGQHESELFMAADKEKDQSYFLYHLGQEKVRNVLFPLGDLMKSQVYELAREFGLTRVAEKKESQGVCFFAESTPKNFLQRHLASSLFEAGRIITVDGRVIGQHKGLPLYTIGQRHGLGIGGVAGEPEGEAWYVVKIDREHNALIVGREKDLMEQVLVCEKMQFVSGKIPYESIEVEVRIRYRAQPIPATLKIKEGRGFVACHKPLRGVSPGQSAVFYQGEKVVGGGIITQTYEEKIPQKSSAERGRIPVAY